ncbi:MAG: hypothetical protein OEM05_11365 [Myxococcales bacterium]|nr:hypothetical protein [Myxococcales bacterium]
MRFRVSIATLLLAAGLAGCGIGESVTGRCGLQQDALQAAQNKRDGLLTRGISRQDVTFRAASDGVLRAQQALRACEDAEG